MATPTLHIDIMNTTAMDDFANSTESLMSTTSKYSKFVVVDHEPDSPIAVIEGITMIIIFIGALFTNMMAMTTILTDKVLRKNFHNVLILNLTIMDLGVTTTSMSFSIWSIFDNGYLLLSNEILCAINGFGAVLFTFGNFTTILAISLDRYLTVCWSTRFPPTKARAFGLVAFCWALPIANVLPPAFEFLSDFKFHPDTHHCSPKWTDCLYFILWFTFIFAITVPMMIFCYVNVIRTIRNQEIQLKSHSGKGKMPSLHSTGTSDSGAFNVSMDTVTMSQSEDMSQVVYTGNAAAAASTSAASQKSVKKQEKKTKIRINPLKKLDELSADKRVAVTGIMLVATTLICWSPYFIIHSCFIPIHVTHWLGVVSMWLGYANSLLDPLVYSFMNRRVRARYRRLIGWKCGTD